MLLCMGLFSRFVVEDLRPGHHHDPAAQHDRGSAAELPQQPGLGAAGVRPVAAEPVVMVARAIRRPCSAEGPAIMRATNLRPSRRPGIGIGRAGVAEDPGARAGRWSIRRWMNCDVSSIQPGIEHRAGMQEHQPGRARLAGAGGERRGARPSNGRKRQPATSATRSITPVPARSTSSTSHTTTCCCARHQRRQSRDRGAARRLRSE